MTIYIIYITLYNFITIYIILYQFICMLYTHSKRQTCIETGRHEIIQSVGHAFWGVGSQRYRTPSGLRGGRIICCPRVCPNGTRSGMFYSVLTAHARQACWQTYMNSVKHACMHTGTPTHRLVQDRHAADLFRLTTYICRPRVCPNGSCRHPRVCPNGSCPEIMFL